jgi:predicted transcriptional regulator
MKYSIRVSPKVPYNLDLLLRKKAEKLNNNRTIIVGAALTEYLAKLNKAKDPAA